MFGTDYHNPPKKYEEVITEEELLKALKKIFNNKSSENDGLTKECYEAFCNDLKAPLLLSVNKAFNIGELSTSRKQLSSYQIN